GSVAACPSRGSRRRVPRSPPPRNGGAAEIFPVSGTRSAGCGCPRPRRRRPRNPAAAAGPRRTGPRAPVPASSAAHATASWRFCLHSIGEVGGGGRAFLTLQELGGEPDIGLRAGTAGVVDEHRQAVRSSEERR